MVGLSEDARAHRGQASGQAAAVVVHALHCRHFVHLQQGGRERANFATRKAHRHSYSFCDTFTMVCTNLCEKTDFAISTICRPLTCGNLVIATFCNDNSQNVGVLCFGVL